MTNKEIKIKLLQRAKEYLWDGTDNVDSEDLKYNNPRIYICSALEYVAKTKREKDVAEILCFNIDDMIRGSMGDNYYKEGAGFSFGLEGYLHHLGLIPKRFKNYEYCPQLQSMPYAKDLMQYRRRFIDHLIKELS